MDHLILELSELAKIELPLVLVGGKAANLGKLIKYGFQVPDGIIITTNVYDQFIENNGLKEDITKELDLIDYSDINTIEKTAKNIQESIRKALLPPQLTKFILNNERIDKLSPIAIRSSATAEDLPTASFAGQQETFLNVHEKNQILHYIKECFASLWSTRTIVYRNQHKIPQETVKLAIILQMMISGVSAGVIFTQSPFSPNKDDILIESTQGLGESLVSGQISPDQFSIRRREIQSKESFEIISREITHKEFIFKNGEVGIEKIPLSVEEQTEPSISDEQVLHLADISKKIENSFGSPQDIEWVYSSENILYITQSRPITTTQLAINQKDATFWTRGYADDYWNDPTSPLFFDLLGTQLKLIVNTELNSIMGYPKISDELLYLHHSHVYFNLETLMRKVEYEIPPFIRTDDVLNYFPEGSGVYGKKTVRKMPFRLGKRIISELRVILHDNANGSILNTAKTYQKWTEEEFWPFCKEFDSLLSKYVKKGKITTIIELGDTLEHKMASHFRMVRYGIPVHNIGMNLLSTYLLTRFIGKDLARGLYPILISGLWHKASETNEQVQNLAAKGFSYPKLLHLIQNNESVKLYSILKNNHEDARVKAFIDSLEEFLQLYGDRGFAREMCYPRWREDPSYVLDQIKGLVNDQKVDTNMLKTQSMKRRQRVEGFVAYRIRSTRFGFLKYKFFHTVLNLARKYIIFRENQRYNLDKWITRNRNLYLEIGKDMVVKGYLNDPTDIFFLYKREIQKILSHSINIKPQKLLRIIQNRKDDFKKYEFAIPPKFLHGLREFDDPISKSDNKYIFKGIPASHGTITARTLILTDIRQVSSVKAGDILIVPKTDPGWTPIFAKIGGLITETGGILSHGAVVSREYGIPSVTNVINACTIFKSGMTVRIDGTKGIVKILSDPD